MANNSNAQVPGMIYPTQIGMLAGNPRDSAIQQMNNTNMTQSNLNAAVGGKKRGGAVVIPQFQMQYTPQGGQGQTPNSIIQQNLQNGTQGVANSQYDMLATQQGGKRKYKTHKRIIKKTKRFIKKKSRKQNKKQKITRKK